MARQVVFDFTATAEAAAAAAAALWLSDKKGSIFLVACLIHFHSYMKYIINEPIRRKQHFKSVAMNPSLLRLFPKKPKSKIDPVHLWQKK